jgi:hypothetical protein
MYVSRHFLVCRLEVKGVNLYTKKHLNTCVSIINQNILYFEMEGVHLTSPFSDHQNVTWLGRNSREARIRGFC